MRRTVLELGVPVLLVAMTALVAGAVSQAHQLEFENALVMTAIVVALYVFVGNSGVISFGHVSFVAVGAYLAGVLTVDPETKSFTMPGLFHVLAHSHVRTVQSLALAAAAGGVYALAVGLPLMRLSGLPAGIATFAILGITYNVLYYWQKVGPAAQTLSDIPGTGRWTLAAGDAIAIVAAYAYQRSRFGRMLRATREDPAAAGASGISVYRQRLLGFTLSGALAGLAGGLYVHELGLITPDLFYLDLTFVTLAMLVVRRRRQPVGSGARRARDQRAELVPRRRGEHGARRLPAHAARRHAARHDRRGDGARDHPAPVGPHRRPRVRLEAPVTRVCVAGAGTIGSLFAAHLAQRDGRVGADAPRRARGALNEHGLRVSGPRGLHGRGDRGERSRRARSADLLILACKGSDLEPLAQRLEGHFEGATVMTVQNGLGAEEIVGAHGDWPLLSAVTFMSGTRVSDTHVEYILDTATWIGPYRDTTPEMRARSPS